MIADLKPYPAYHDSGVAWLGEAPAHWTIERAKNLFRRVERPLEPAHDVVTCFRDGTVTLRKNRRLSGFTESLKEIGYQGVQRGDLVIHAMDAFAGAVGVSDSDGKCTPVYAVCEPRRDASSAYYAHVVREMARSRWIVALAKGIRERSTDFRFESFASQVLPVPPREEQEAIVRFLEHADRHIRRYIRAKLRVIALVGEQREKLTVDALALKDSRRVRLAIATSQVVRPVDRHSDETYTPIGLLNRGRGIFLKSPTRGADLGDSSFYWVAEGDLVLSGQFAWEGAVALAGHSADGCIASHRYPILGGEPDVADTGFLFAYFRTDWGQLLLDVHSRGAAGRNRPLNVSTLMKEEIVLPPLYVQQKIAALVKLEARLREKVAQLTTQLREYRSRFISDVVTGKLDVREAAARLPDVLDADPVQDPLDDDTTSLDGDDADAEALDSELQEA